MKKKRLLAVVLSLAMAVTAVPVSVFGEDADTLIEAEDSVLEEDVVEESAPYEDVVPKEDAGQTEESAKEVLSEDVLVIEEEDVSAGEIPAEQEDGTEPSSQGDGAFLEIDDVDVAAEEEGPADEPNTSIWSKLEFELGDDETVTVGPGEVTGSSFESGAVVTFNPFHEGKFEPKVKNVKYNGKDLETDDYSVESYNSTAVGEGRPYLLFTFKKGGEADGVPALTVYYTIEPLDLSQSSDITGVNVIVSATGNMPKYIYSGKPQVPDLSVSLEPVEPIEGKDSITLEMGSDFEVHAVSNDDDENFTDEDFDDISAGDVKYLVVKGKGRYKGIVDSGLTYKIDRKSVTPSDVSIPTDRVYKMTLDSGEDNPNAKGGKIAEDITKGIVDKLRVDQPPISIDNYEITFQKYEYTTGEWVSTTGTQWSEDNFPDIEGAYQYTVKFVADYQGSLTGSYKVQQHAPLIEMKSALQDMLNAEMEDHEKWKGEDYDLTYNNVDRTEDIKKAISHVLKENHMSGDYLKIEPQGAPIVNAGEYDVKVTGLSDESPWGKGSILLKMHVYPKELAQKDSDSNLEVRDDYTINVEAYKHSNGQWCKEYIDVVIVDTTLGPDADSSSGGESGDNDKILQKGTDYEVTFDLDSDPYNIVVNIAGKGNYQTVYVSPDDPQEYGDLVVYLKKKDVEESVSLEAPFFKAEFVGDLSFDFSSSDQGGNGPSVSAGDFTVREECEDGYSKVLTPHTDYVIGKYEGSDSKWTDVPPSSAGKHRVKLEGTGSFSGSLLAEYNIKGEPFGSSFKADSSIDPIEVLETVDLPTPKVKYTGTGSSFADALDEKGFIYTYYKQSDFEELQGGGTGAPLCTWKEDSETDDSKTYTFTETGDYILAITINRDADIAKNLEMFDDNPVIVPFKVVGRDIADTEVEVDEKSLSVEWPGDAVTENDLNFTMRDRGIEGDGTLEEGKDYELEITGGDPTKIGNLEVTIQGTGAHYSGSRTVTVEIKPKELASADVEILEYELPYLDGSSYDIPGNYVRVTVESEQGESYTVEPEEYTVKFDRAEGLVVNDLVGLTIEAKPDMHYTGQATTDEKVLIAIADIEDEEIFEVRGLESVVYSGQPCIPEVILWNKVAQKEVPAEFYEVKPSEPGDMVNAGSYLLEIEAIDVNYEGSIAAKFEIVKAENSLTAKIDPPAVLQGASAVITATGEGEITCVQTGGSGSVTIQGTTVTGVNVGDVTVTVTAGGDQNHNSGTATVQLTVTKKEETIEGAEITLSASTYVYDGKAKEPAVTVSKDGKTLAAGTDYKVAYKDNVNAGMATVTVTGIGAYTGFANKTFTIEKAENKITVKATSIKKYYSKSSQKTDKIAKATALGSAKVRYKVDDSTFKVSSGGRITIPAGFIGTAKITITAEETANYKAAKKTVTLKVYPRKVTLKSAKMDKGKLKLTWTKCDDCSGFQILTSTNKKFTKKLDTVWVKKPKATSVRFKRSLKKGTKYYVKVRVYKKVKGKNYYSNYSNIKSFTFK